MEIEMDRSTIKTRGVAQKLADFCWELLLKTGV
jgi:hypothetical protein